MTEIPDHDFEKDLGTPTGGIAAPVVKIEMTPSDGGCLIYGDAGNGKFVPFEVRGSQRRLELPFLNPKIRVKRLSNTKDVSIEMIGWTDIGLSEGR